MQFSIYWFRKRKKEIEIMSLFGKKKDEKEIELKIKNMIDRMK